MKQGRAAGGALLFWYLWAVSNAMGRCQRSRGPSLGAGSGRVLVLLPLFIQNERLQTSEKKPVSCVSKAIAHPAPKLSTFWVSGTAKAELALPWWAFLKGLGLSPGKRQPCIHRGRAGALEIRILIKLLSFYFKNQNSSNGFHFPPTENRILRKICNLSLKNLSANYIHFHTGDHFHDNSTQSTK